MGHVAREKILNAYNILVGKPEGNYRLEDLRVYEKLTLKCIFKKLTRRVRAWDTDQYTDSCESRRESSGFTECREFIEWLGNC
jgi:hypothetical protein